MSGVPTPVYPIVRPFGNSALAPADPGGATLPIPIPSQVGVLVGAASFTDGFPAATMTDPEAGGIAPYGQDFNGIAYMLSAYLAMIQAGQTVTYNAFAVGEFVGYVKGAKLASVAVPGLVWTNNLDANATDPDVDPSNWIASIPRQLATAPGAGTINNAALPGPSDYVWDVDTAAGAVNFSGFIAQRDGQRIYLSNIGANLLQVLALNGGSTAARQVRNATDLALVQNQTLTIQYAAGAPGGGKWLLV
jgi:hypothetical protein